MYISVVEIELPPGTDVAALKDLFPEAGRRYTRVEGLLRKYYAMKDGNLTGGVFVWDTLEHAEAGHADPEWHRIIRDRYATEPRVTYYEIPVIVDNVLGGVHTAPEYLKAVAWDEQPALARNAGE